MQCGEFMPTVKAPCARSKGHKDAHKDESRMERDRARMRLRSGKDENKPGRYDAADYAEEFQQLTDMMIDSKYIITHSHPSAIWFRKNVAPLVTEALCHSCRKIFNPRETMSILACSSSCPANASRWNYE